MDPNNQTIAIFGLGKFVQISARLATIREFEAGSSILTDLPVPFLDKDRIIKTYDSTGQETATIKISSKGLTFSSKVAALTDMRFDASYISG